MSGQKGKPGYLTPGTMVGPYEVEEQLGGGGFGVVYQVRRDGQPYALKIAHTKLSNLPAEDRAAAIDRLDREIAALKSLRHPNIVRVHSFERWPDLEGGYPYLVMDLVDGTPLQEWRVGSGPSLSRIVGVFEKVADALAHMHALSIIHRDLKSQNILVTGTGEPFIVDFGIARPRVAYELTRTAAVGTLTHLTPEYAVFLDTAEGRRGSPFDWRPTTDLYALGYVLYEALTGQPPVPRSSSGSASEEAELLVAIKGTVPRRPRELEPDIPEVLDALVMELLEKDPTKRPQDAAQVVRRLREAREEAAATGDAAWISPFDGTEPRDAGNLAGQEEPSDVVEPIEPPVAVVPAVVEPAPGAARERASPPRAPAPPSEAKSGASVSLPTPEQAPPFDDGEGAPAESPAESDSWRKESQILSRAAAVFEAATPKPRRWPIALAAGAGGLVVLLLAVIAVRTPGDRPQPKTLLSAGETGALPPVSAPSAPAAEPPRVSGPPPAVEAAPSARLQREDLRPAAGAVTAGSAPRIPDAELEYGRLTLLPDGQVVIRRPPPVEEASGLVRSRPLGSEPGVLPTSQKVAAAASSSPAAPKGRGVAYGAHIQARLLTNLDTRTIANGPVEALVHVPYVVRGQVVLPTRTMAYGTATESSGRFTVRFTRMRLPDDTEVAFEGIAMARDEGKPGLAATGRVGQEPKQAEALGTRIAKGTGNLLLDTIAGGTPQTIVRNAGQTALNHEEPQPVSSQWALLLEAGAVFDIFVEKAF